MTTITTSATMSGASTMMSGASATTGRSRLTTWHAKQQTRAGASAPAPALLFMLWLALRVSEKTSPLDASANAAGSQSYAGGPDRGYGGGGSFPKVYAWASRLISSSSSEKASTKAALNS